jgi:LuxR family maltose regulon positive regulatory protein
VDHLTPSGTFNRLTEAGASWEGRHEEHEGTTLDNAGPLLETKLYVPRLRRSLVPRPRLSERLSRGAESKLTLISAPAGFGKTTLLAEWLALDPDSGRATAWLPLDQGDNESASFWTYLITALQTVAPGVGANALSTLRESQPPRIETVVATLLNELSGAERHRAGARRLPRDRRARRP